MKDFIRFLLAFVFGVSVVVFLASLTLAIFCHGHSYDGGISAACIISFCTMVLSEGISIFWDDGQL